MKRETAWKGFYITIKKIQQARTERKPRKFIRALFLQAARYGKSLVLEHGWEDQWTMTYTNYTLRRK